MIKVQRDKDRRKRRAGKRCVLPAVSLTPESKARGNVQRWGKLDCDGKGVPKMWTGMRVGLYWVWPDVTSWATSGVTITLDWACWNEGP